VTSSYPIAGVREKLQKFWLSSSTLRHVISSSYLNQTPKKTHEQRQINLNQVFKYVTGRRLLLLGQTVEEKGALVSKTLSS
jgi:hypothetical protein